MLSNSTMLMWLEPPSPMVAYCSSLGLARAKAINSASDLNGEADGTTRIWFDKP